MGYSSPAQFGIMTDLNETLAEVTLILVIIFILSAVDTIYHDFVFLFVWAALDIQSRNLLKCITIVQFWLLSDFNYGKYFVICSTQSLAPY